jgi:acyl-CoA thioesterase
MIKGSPFLEFLKINLEEVREGYERVSAIVDKNYLNMHGGAHGSFIFAVADAAFEYVSNYSRNSVALNVNIHFRRPSFEGEKLIAEAFEESSGNTTSLYKILVKNNEGKIIAYVTALVYHLDGKTRK